MQALLERVRAYTEAQKDTVRAVMPGTYSRLFATTKSTMQIERVAHVQLTALARERKPGWGEGFDNAAGQRFVYCAETHEAALGFQVVPDGDHRAGIIGSDREPQIYGLAELKIGAEFSGPNVRLTPWRESDLLFGFYAMINLLRGQREVAAAHVFNTARTYDPSIAGDGVSMCSDNHPHDKGVWSNVGDAVLSADNLEKALDHIAQRLVDDSGTKIHAYGKRLVVPRALQDVAKKLRFPYVVWDHLLNPKAWFVQTSVGGLCRYERHPLEFDAWHDVERDAVVVKAHERDCFTYHDPRAIYGSFPS